jgi:16S rRNA (uracil1498-N3)-methyltransferase
MTTSFYAPPSAIREGAYVVLPDDEATHAVRVLRKRPGDEIVVVDGVGGWHRVRLDHADRKSASGPILETRRDVGEPAYTLSIGLALLKNRSRFETFLEKAVELGVREVIPLRTHRTEKGQFKVQRAEQLLIAAMKQCGRSRLVRLAPLQSLAVVLGQDDAELTLIAHEQTAPEESLARVLAAHPAVPSLRVLIGPEGGFRDEEITEAQQAGYMPVSLGLRRLRAETAALVAAATVMTARS